MKHVDIAIVGGGIVGCSLALALAQFTDLKIALIEALSVNDQADLNALDQRSIALSLPSCRLLKHLGVWHYLQQHAQPIEHIEVSEQGAWSKVRLNAKQLGYAAFGYVIPLSFIQQKVNAKLQDHQSHILHLPATKLCELYFAAEQSASLTLQQQDDPAVINLQAQLVIGADGTGSTVRQLANIAVEQQDYKQQALVTNIQFKRAHNGRSFERFTQSGSLGLLPLTEQRMALFWAAPPVEAQELLNLSAEDFLQCLQQTIGYTLGRCEMVGKRVIFPLKKTIAKSHWREHCVLLGNAEHTLHPLSAQGLNLGLYDLACLFDVLQESIERQEPIGSIKTLERYSKRKHHRNQHVIRDIDTLLAGFANPLRAVSQARRAWLSSLELIGMLRQLRVQRMLGYRLPSLLTSSGVQRQEKAYEAV